MAGRSSATHAKLIDEVNVYPLDTTLGGMDTPEEMNAMCLSACHSQYRSHTYTLWNGDQSTGVPIGNMNTGRPDAVVGLPFFGGSELGIRGYDEIEVDDTVNPDMILIRRHKINLPAFAQQDTLLGYGDTQPDSYDSNTLTHPSASWIPFDDDGDQQPDNGDFDVLHAPSYDPDNTPTDGLPFFRKGSNETGTLDPTDTTARGAEDL